jgi:hypothetical protein
MPRGEGGLSEVGLTGDTKNMRRYLPRIRVFGANRDEFRTSIWVAIVGYILVLSVLPPRAFGYDEPSHSYLLSNTAHVAGQFIVALASLLCAINAYRDRENVWEERLAILAWCLLLCLWMMLSLTSLLSWWGRIPPLLRPVWLQDI